MATAAEKAAKQAAKAQKKANKQSAKNANAKIPTGQTVSPVSLPVGAKGPGLPSNVNPLMAGAINTPYWQKQYQANPSAVTAAYSPPALNQLSQFYTPQAGGAPQTTTSAANQIFGGISGGNTPPPATPPSISPPPPPVAGPPGAPPPGGGKGGDNPAFGGPHFGRPPSSMSGKGGLPQVQPAL